MPNRKGRTTVMAIGAGIGVVWIILATLALLTAIEGSRADRGDVALGWGLVGFFLLLAGLAAIIGTWWHQYREPEAP